ncbi:hypothetical protein PV10_00782 [Exophiala mesophila]|uniref:HMA domain-containing protein n=1 Tax=Exophiala mesophila TaxID=212818 RepID=A0A0D1ZQX2_EXOME|nr:uncharacterized protein PV10_00782 [Exophiala mesophila]KIV96972.1 hypothetical protein PV10_00782 [Exophiala mesophila]
MAFHSTFLVSNIHCPSCVSYATDLLRPISGVQATHVSLIDHTIQVKHDHGNLHELIAKRLLDAAFQVQHVTTVDSDGHLVKDYDMTPATTIPSIFRFRRPKANINQKHIDNCDSCRRENQTIRSRKTPSSMLKSFSSKNMSAEELSHDYAAALESTNKNNPRFTKAHEISDSDEGLLFTATVLITGMTCSSCTGTITKELEKLDFVKTAQVNLLSNSARVLFCAPESHATKIVQAIDDLGYEAVLDNIVQEEVNAPQSHELFKTVLSIDGMTCGTCVGSVTDALQRLDWVRSVNVDLIGKACTVTYQGSRNLDAIIRTIDDLGYEATEVTTAPLSSQTSPTTRQRTVALQIDGMFCNHCPQKIREAVELWTDRLGDPPASITRWPTLKDPIITVTYTPSPPEITVRKLIGAIDGAHDAFKASVFHPPSLEERSRQMRSQEQKQILWRLIFTAIAAVPSFIIGVVFMSLVPNSNRTKAWFQQPIFGGSAMRMDWALFIITTPVMVFGTDIFHRRAIKEIVSMWQPRSTVPLLRRFYRFGSMNLLISAGTSVAYFSSLAVLAMDAATPPMTTHENQSSSSYFDTVTFLTLFILIGKYLEAYSKAKTGDAVAMLSGLRPTEARLVIGTSPKSSHASQVVSIPVDQLEIGDIVQVPHGASPPTDGIIAQEGQFLFDESSLTGESKPAKKNSGDFVYTGSVNVSEPVQLRVTDLEGSSMLDQIVKVVREGQGKRAPIERVADVITGYFVPVITLLAILTWIIWLSVGVSGKLPAAWLDVTHGGWAFWSLQFAIAVFVVACPCGIGLAAPTALFVGGGLAAKQGVLVQGGGEAFQDASKLEVIVFDKTGTLTQGQMQVIEFERVRDDMISNDMVFAMCNLLEESSNHPIAKALASYCGQNTQGTALTVSNIKEIPGHGMTGIVIDETETLTTRYEVVVGNEKLLQSLSTLDMASHDPENLGSSIGQAGSPGRNEDSFYLTSLLQRHQSMGHSTAIVAVRCVTIKDGETISDQHFTVVGIFAIADPVRTEATDVLKRLRDRGLEVHMCSGDQQRTALAIASQVGIQAQNVRAGVLPHEKAAYIHELQGVADGGKRRVVGFVGDGTNDTPALSAADVSIALSTGSDVAMTTASFILLNSNLETILSLVRLAKRVFLRVKLNFAWAAIYNICLIPVAAGVFYTVSASEQHAGWKLGPVWASAAMALSSVSVVLSSLALRLPELQIGSK